MTCHATVIELVFMVEMQNPADIVQRSGGGGMNSPPSAGMGGGLGQGMHAPTIRPHHPPPPSSAINPSQGATPGMSHPQPESSPSGLRPMMSTPPPSSLGMSIGMAGTSVVGSGVGTGSGGEQPPKRKRGRPRKYETGASSSPGVPGAVYPVLPTLMPASSSPYTPGSEKRGRGRPPGSGKKAQLAALGEKSSLSILVYQVVWSVNVHSELNAILYVMCGCLCFGKPLLLIAC